jgi:hypothetical protein
MFSIICHGFFARKERKMTDISSIGPLGSSIQDIVTGNSEAPTSVLGGGTEEAATSVPGGGTEEAATSPTDYLSSFGGGEVSGGGGEGEIAG